MEMNNTVDNVLIRQQANEIFRERKGLLIGMMVSVIVITLALNLAVTFLTAALASNSPSQTLYFYSNPIVTTTNTGAVGIVSLLGSLAVTLVTGALNLGHTKSIIDLCRGEDVRVSGIFCRMGSFFKAFLLNLWISLKMFFWALPAFVLLILGATMGVAQESEFLVAVLPFAGMCLMLGLMIPAALRYALATFVLADDPDRGVNECVELSKQMMAGRKWQYFKLCIPYALKFMLAYLAVVLVGSLLIGLLGDAMAVLSSLVMVAGVIAAAVFFLVPMPVACSLFYIKRKG